MSTTQIHFDPKTDLILERVVDVSPEQIFAAWTTPKLITQWFAPNPWKAVEAQVDLRPGGLFHVVMKSPEGEEMPCNGCFLEIVKNERLVWTDVLTAGYRPSAAPFFTGAISMEPHPRGARYTAHAMHKDEETRRKHEEMGFHSGWNQCLDQLVDLMKSENRVNESAGLSA